MQRQTAKSIDKLAAEWAARCDARALSVQEQAALDAWLASDVRCLGAYARARAALCAVEHAPRLYQPAARAPQLTRRTAIAASVVGVAAVFALAQSRHSAATPRKYESVLGEVRTIPLEDGSKLTLSTDTALTVDYRPGKRVVRLLRGEAYFEVAKNRDRPFIVVGPHAQARAVGTAYSVRLFEDGPMQVLVAEGRVSVERARALPSGPLAAFDGLWPAGDNADALVYLDAGQVATVRLAGAGADSGRVLVSVASLGADAADRALLWREGRLSFEGQTLAAAAAEFARFSARRIVIEDAHLAQEHISGLFAASDPAGFARAAAIGMSAKLKIDNNNIILYR